MHDHITVTKAGANISSAATTARAAIPPASSGELPRKIRVAATAAAYVRLGIHALASTATISAAGTGYIPAETITLTGGAASTQAILTIVTTKVVSATVNAGGASGVDGTATVTGTTGTGTKFQATVTITAGAIASVDSIDVAGSYTANPTSIAAEPVTGGSVVGGTLAVVMGVATSTVTNAGNYSVLPANPVAQGSTSGTGTGATHTMTYTGAAIAAVAGDTLVQPGDAIVMAVPQGITDIAALRVTADGVVQISPLEDM